MQPVVGSIDVPTTEEVVDRDRFRVRGWAYSPVSPVARVDVILGGRWLGRVGLGRHRPDVAEHLEEPDAALSGFEFSVCHPAVAAGSSATLEAVVTLVDGTRTALAAAEVHVRPDSRDPVPAPLADFPKPPRPRLRPPGTIRVLWSARGLDQGGSQLRMAETIETLQERGGFQSTVISPSDGPLRPRLEMAGAAVELIPAVPLDDAAGYERAIRPLGAWFGRYFDLVVGFTVTSFPAVDAALRHGLPAVLRIGEAAPLGTVVGWLFGSLDPEVERRARRAVAGASAVVSNSHAAVETYRAEGYEGRFVVVPTGVVPTPPDGAVRQECRRQAAIGPDERVLLYPASLWPVKGQWVLVRALGLVLRRHPHLGCVLIGHDDVLYARTLRSFVERNGLSGAVRIRPFAGDLGPWWSGADVIVCASESEAMPAAVLEGMAHGLPALASRVGDLPRLIEPGVNGWLCDHSDVASMAQALETVARSSPEELQRMGEAALTSVARAHDHARASDRWVELLRSAAG